MIIRKAKKKDLKEIAKLLHEYTIYEHELNKEVRIESLKELEKEEKEHMKLGTEYLLAEDEDKDNHIVGLLNISIDKRGKVKIGVIHNLIVTKNYRGKGIGSKLVKYAFIYFKSKGCKRIKTFIHIANKNAKGFWQKQGFNLEEGFHASKRL